MTTEIMTWLAILGAAVVLFSWDRIAADAVTGLVPVEEVLAGFGGGTVVMISVSLLSAFISNTAATAFFVPVVLGIAARIGASPSRLLLPLAFASILTSSVTLISTSTDIMISELMVRNGMPPMGLFEPAPVSIPLAIAGILYMLTLGLRQTPDRARDAATPEEVGNRRYAADLVVPDGSPLIGKTLAQSPIGEETGFTVVRLLRDATSEAADTQQPEEPAKKSAEEPDAQPEELKTPPKAEAEKQVEEPAEDATGTTERPQQKQQEGEAKKDEKVEKQKGKKKDECDPSSGDPDCQPAQ